MKEYNVTITETLQKTVTVEAESCEMAEQTVSEWWKRGRYILDADDFVNVDFSAEERASKQKAQLNSLFK